MGTIGRFGVICSLFTLAALAGADEPEEGGRLTYSERQPLLGFEPVIRTNVSTTRFGAMIFEQLLDRKITGIGVECRLCESFTSSEKIVTFSLKSGVKWHDLHPVTAYDVAFTFRAVTNPETGSSLGKELENIEDATVVDDRTVSFTMKAPVAVPEAYFMALPILPAHMFSVFTPSLTEDPDPGRVREVRIHQIEMKAEADETSRLVGLLPIGAQLALQESNREWAKVKVIDRGPVGWLGWIRLHEPIISSRTSPDFLVNPIGSGPYKFVTTTINGDAVLSRFEEYHGARKPLITKIRRKRSSDIKTMVTRFTSEIIDLIPEIPLEELARVSASGVAKIVPYPSLRFQGLLYNMKNPYLSQKKFRHALTLGTNRAQWLDVFYQGQGTLIGGPAGPDSWLYDSRIEPFPYDPKTAKQLIHEVTGGQPVSFNLIVSNDRTTQDMDMLQAFVNAADALGVQIQITVMESGVYADTVKKGDFEIAFRDYLFSFGYNFRPLFEPEGVQNYGFYENPELGEIFDRWRRETDFEKVRGLAFRSQEILREDCPYIFLWSLQSLAAVNNKVRNIRPETIDPYRFFAWVHRWWIPSIYQ